MREKFEAWISASGRAHLLVRDETHDWYKDLTVTAMWTAWQASRDGEVVRKTFVFDGVRGPNERDSWVPLTIEYEPGYPEDVAFGTKRQMDRLKKWLEKFFAMRTAEKTADSDTARLDWLQTFTDGFYNLDRISSTRLNGFNGNKSLREAIDAAIRAEIKDQS